MTVGGLGSLSNNKFELEGLDKVLSAFSRIEKQMRHTLAAEREQAKASKESAKSLEELNKSGKLIGLNQGVELAKTGLRALTSIAKKLFAAMKDGADSSEAWMVALNRGVSSSLISRMDKLSGSMIDITSLTRVAAKGKQLGLSDTQLGTISQLTSGITSQTGGDPIQIMNTLTDAIAKGRVQALQSFGVYVDVKAAMDEYAKSVGKTTGELTQLERQEASLAYIQRNNAELTKKTADTNAQKIRTLGKYVADLKSDFYEGWSAGLLGVDKNLDTTSQKLEEQIKVIQEKLVPSWRQFISGGGFAVLNYNDALLRLQLRLAMVRDEEDKLRDVRSDVFQTMTDIGFKYNKLTVDDIPKMEGAVFKLRHELANQIKAILDSKKATDTMAGTIKKIDAVSETYGKRIKWLTDLIKKFTKQNQAVVGIKGDKTKSDEKKKGKQLSAQELLNRELARTSPNNDRVLKLLVRIKVGAEHGTSGGGALQGLALQQFLATQTAISPNVKAMQTPGPAAPGQPGQKPQGGGPSSVNAPNFYQVYAQTADTEKPRLLAKTWADATASMKSFVDTSILADEQLANLSNGISAVAEASTKGAPGAISAFGKMAAGFTKSKIAMAAIATITEAAAAAAAFAIGDVKGGILHTQAAILYGVAAARKAFSGGGGGGGGGGGVTAAQAATGLRNSALSESKKESPVNINYYINAPVIGDQRTIGRIFVSSANEAVAHDPNLRFDARIVGVG